MKNKGVAVADSALANTTSIATQSAFTGDSFGEAMSNQITNIAIAAIANVAAQEIGSNYKNSDKTATDRTIQLASHAALGCASASAGGGDCASGAVAGVVGELAAEYAKDSLYPDQNVASLTEQQKTNIKELAGLAGGFSAIFTGNLAGLDDSEVAENIFSGQRIGKNAAANNALYVLDQKIPFTEWFTTDKVKDFDLNFGVQGTLAHVTGSAGTDGLVVTGELNPTIGIAGYISITPRGENEFATITYGVRSGPAASVIVTERGNHGLSASFGPALPLYPIPYNISKEIPIEK